MEAKLPEVRVSFSFTKDSYVKGVRTYLRKSWLIGPVHFIALGVAIAAAVGMMALLRTVSFFPLLLLVLSVILSGYGGYLYLWRPARLFERNPALARPVSYCFTDEDFARTDEEGSGLYPWNAVKLWRTEDCYYLFLPDGYLMFPREAFMGQEEAFEAIVREANPDLKWKTW